MTEGMPGTWSHCGKRDDHPAHRHRVVMNEGPYENVLCKGTPGDPSADAPVEPVSYSAP